MLEGILYFVLGFLSAGLLALMISPAIWNRAVALTKKRIESSVPLTLNEIQADKDQLRAEFAMSTRRLEMSVEELREKAAIQVIEINRKRDQLAKLAEESQEKIAAVQELETRSSELRNVLRQREEALMRANEQHDELQRQLEARAIELEKVRTQLVSAQSEADGRRIELIAKETAMENLADRITDMTGGDGHLAEELQTATNEVATTKSELAAIKLKFSDLQDRYERNQKQFAESEEKLERSERDLKEMRKTSGSGETTNSELTRELIDEKALNVELSAKLAQVNLQMESLLNDASNENVEAAMGTLKAEKFRLQEKMAEITRERDKLQDALKAYERNEVEDWESERRENALLRERINDLAAQVTSMTASIEGEGSPINKILANANTPRRARSAKSGGKSAEAAGTLADRIRALQETARAVNK